MLINNSKAPVANRFLFAVSVICYIQKVYINIQVFLRLGEWNWFQCKYAWILYTGNPICCNHVLMYYRHRYTRCIQNVTFAFIPLFLNFCLNTQYDVNITWPKIHR